MIFSTTYVLYMFGIAYLFFMCTNGGSKKSYFKTLATCTIDKPRDMHANLSALFRLPDFMGDLANAGLCLGIFFWQTLLSKAHSKPKKIGKVIGQYFCGMLLYMFIRLGVTISIYKSCND